VCFSDHICRDICGNVAVGAFIGNWNDYPRPFAWTKDGDEILASIQRAKTKTNSLTRH
jgi:hypothetical protein